MTVPPWTRSCGEALNDLRRRDGVALVSAEERTDGIGLLTALGDAFGNRPVSVSEAALDLQPTASASELAARLADASLLFDLEVICWRPGLRIDPVRFLRNLATTRGVVALWPGSISGDRATFSAPGRTDHVDADIGGIAVLRPLTTHFPDQVPFTIERIPS